MNNITTLCCMGILFIMVLFILPRLLGGTRDYSRRGSEAPRYDDPNIRSRGSFGGFRRTPSNRGSSGGRVDSPNIRSRGGFGRDKE